MQRAEDQYGVQVEGGNPGASEGDGSGPLPSPTGPGSLLHRPALGHQNVISPTSCLILKEELYTRKS